MANLAIKGHKSRGEEVIEILEMLGGKNLYNYYADCDSLCFYMQRDKIIYRDDVNNCEDLLIFTLEEFLEKFPYKVGDRVRVAEYESEVRIDDMKWDGNEVQYEVFTDETEWYISEELNLFNKPCKEETMEDKELKRLIRKAELYDKLVSKGFVNIEKVCEWLSDNMKNYAAFDSDIIKDLKKQWRDNYAEYN